MLGVVMYFNLSENSNNFIEFNCHHFRDLG